jgi:Rrf2 family iron-sulfur cluster assembly transcriptional regulator
MGEVITLMDGQGGPRRATSALDERLWAGLAARIEAFLGQLTLADFAARPEVREALVDQYTGSGWRCDVCGALSTRQQPAAGESGR